MAQLGGFDSEFRFSSRGDIRTQTNVIVLESVLLWESASLAGLASRDLWRSSLVFSVTFRRCGHCRSPLDLPAVPVQPLDSSDGWRILGIRERV